MSTRNIESPLPTGGSDHAAEGAVTLARNLARFGVVSAAAAKLINESEPASLSFMVAADGAPVAQVPNGARLASVHQPVKEAARWAGAIDVTETACAVVLGFGVGHHVRALVEKLQGTGVVVIYEPDAGLLKAVLSHIDCSEWLDPDRVRWVVDAHASGVVTSCLSGLETHLVAGTRLLEHPASMARLGDGPRHLGAQVADAVANARMSMTTLLMRSAGTVQNELRNIDRYALGAGIDELENIASGALGIVVSAGPSLKRNIDLLAQEGVRDRCVIVAAQTTLRPLLDAGVRPHFVAALDYHEISKRFYEGITEADVAGTTLIALPQAHPVIAESWPGAVRWCRALVLEHVLGSAVAQRAGLESAGTVAHLAYLFAQFLGCDPIALIGQDLGFTDGVYYSRGTAIDDVWMPELNPFNTIAMMEWQRIVRHKGMLHRLEDIHGRSILTDDQMLSYLQRFELLFGQAAAQGKTTIDATEGGVKKSNTQVMSLKDVLDGHLNDSDLLRFPIPTVADRSKRKKAVVQQLNSFRSDVKRLGALSASTARDLEDLAICHRDEAAASKIFVRIDKSRGEVEKMGSAFQFVDRVNQLGAFKRFLADRKINLSETNDQYELQRQQIDRDVVNVQMLEEAAVESVAMLDEAIELMTTGSTKAAEQTTGTPVTDSAFNALGPGLVAMDRVVAFVPIDPAAGGAGSMRSLRESIGGINVLQATLERLGQSERLEKIIVLLPDDCALDDVVNTGRIPLPVQIERCGESPFGAEHEAIVAARMFADRSWRGGIAGMTVFDEVLAASTMNEVMEREGIDGAILCGPDWPFVDVVGEGGVDALIDQWRAIEGRQSCVFTQAPPGLGACLLSRKAVANLAPVNRLATVGSMLGYRPERPEHDPIAREGNVQISAKVRSTKSRVIYDSPRCRLRMQRAVEPILSSSVEVNAKRIESRDFVDQLEYVRRGGLPTYAPRHVLVELCTGRLGSGACSPHRNGSIQREPMTRRRFARLISELAEIRDSLLTFGGVGDPLQHPDCFEFIEMALSAGVMGIHVRTELQCSAEKAVALATSGVHVVSVDLNADCAETYRRAMGHDGFQTVLENMQRLVDSRRILQGEGASAFALPWIVPRIQRRIETFEDLEPFYERWQRLLGTPVIDPEVKIGDDIQDASYSLADVTSPSSSMISEIFRRMTVLSDGRVPVAELDLDGRRHVGTIDHESPLELWRRVVGARRRVLRDLGPKAFDLRTYQS